jgi:GNAT superfamily N-acetyltransferase
MTLTWSPATAADAPAITALRNATAADLTARHGEGWWTTASTEKGVLFNLRNVHVFVAREHGGIVATLCLAAKKPWAIDRSFFSPVARPLYLTSMAVAPERQRQGIGRACLAHAAETARRWPANAIFFDSYDHPAGAGEFYRKCGFRETGRATYRNVPLIYFELLV